MIDLIDKLQKTRDLKRDELFYLLSNFNHNTSEYIHEKAREVAQRYFGKKIYTRGLIEFTNYCKNDCFYCGIRYSNKNVDRYRLSIDSILDCCESGYHLGFRTFVLQGGEDLEYTDNDIVNLVSTIKSRFPDCAITLSIGEKSYDSYLAYFKSGADRFLLRHETATAQHYKKLHPHNLTLDRRKQCLQDLKSIGYQVGTGFMVGSPYQTIENLVEDLLFIKEITPQMIGIGPYIPHHDTPFANENAGSLELTLFLISVIRLMNPNALIPATTSLGTIDPNGREMGILAGANVVMPNLSPVNVRKKYELYDNKICTDEEAAECKVCLSNRINKIGYEIVVDRGDYVNI
ncbi:[FeFe] hydrogenase H-cluster radical SAM maturase HydE [Alkalibaculum sp. M08DMB]|uniref:[FeFe] hydrogenase H-cluster radical SAM maturase HydE n=1 Tax=Alkalibaculum sporogenes TaxID=2655001 RepID=A0A6A7K574_9FIRM|nr:[FeFe] hydrogenase H-cluster radical SAM maturase HydE [Alkalibaculum sporogenes]MPW24530.1 [FeFe] hydrogenase H-cluster radical SAM maturase HydE [Alkalibaculum sporogenes]